MYIYILDHIYMYIIFIFLQIASSEVNPPKLFQVNDIYVISFTGI